MNPLGLQDCPLIQIPGEQNTIHAEAVCLNTSEGVLHESSLGREARQCF